MSADKDDDDKDALTPKWEKRIFLRAPFLDAALSTLDKDVPDGDTARARAAFELAPVATLVKTMEDLGYVFPVPSSIKQRTDTYYPVTDDVALKKRNSGNANAGAAGTDHDANGGYELKWLDLTGAPGASMSMGAQAIIKVETALDSPPAAVPTNVLQQARAAQTLNETVHVVKLPNKTAKKEHKDGRKYKTAAEVTLCTVQSSGEWWLSVAVESKKNAAAVADVLRKVVSTLTLDLELTLPVDSRRVEGTWKYNGVSHAAYLASYAAFVVIAAAGKT